MTPVCTFNAVGTETTWGLEVLLLDLLGKKCNYVKIYYDFFKNSIYEFVGDKEKRRKTAGLLATYGYC